ncbi:MAG: alpha/beta hydrolase [Bacteroidaceae bacterium]|nr:alpha/beta hydrolase [Bacteroidaceae bacterium]
MKKRLILLSGLLLAVIGAWAQPEELWIRNGSHNIFGILNHRQGTGKHPLAIIVHGFNGTHDGGLNYFDTFSSLGYMCYTFDFPNGSVNSRSGNNTMEMSVLDEQHDLEAIVRYFKTREDVDAGHIVLVGESQGGLVAALAAAYNPDDISQLVLVYPAISLGNSNDTRPVESMPDTTRIWGVPLGRRFYQELREIHSFDVIGRYEKPVLIVQGDADNVVSLQTTRTTLSKYKDAQLHVIHGAGHGFNGEEMKESLEQIRNFIKRD